MTRRTYTSEYKAKLVIDVLQGEKESNTIAAENGISPNMLRNWKAEWIDDFPASRPDHCTSHLQPVKATLRRRAAAAAKT